MLAALAASARSTARREAEQREKWDTTAELLATLIEVVDLGNRWFFSAHTPTGTKVPDPIVIRRPNRSSQPAEADQPKLTRAAMRAMLLGG